LKFWLKLGFISFGGPAGQISVMHQELRALGYDAKTLQGGVAAWSAMGYATTPTE